MGGVVAWRARSLSKEIHTILFACVVKTKRESERKRVRERERERERERDRQTDRQTDRQKIKRCRSFGEADLRLIENSAHIIINII